MRSVRLTFDSNHVERDFAGGRLVVRVTIEYDELQFTRREEIFFSVPTDFHAHNDLVAAALMAIMGKGYRSARFNFPISTRCAEMLPSYHRLEDVSRLTPISSRAGPAAFSASRSAADSIRWPSGRCCTTSRESISR